MSAFDPKQTLKAEAFRICDIVPTARFGPAFPTAAISSLKSFCYEPTPHGELESWIGVLSNLNLLKLHELSGLELLSEMVAGRIPHPPMADTMGFYLAEVSLGGATFHCEVGPHLLNPFGTVHGGLALCLLDSAAGCAVHSLLPAGVGYASVETKVNYTRPLRGDSGLIRGVGVVLFKGGKIATAEAKLFTADDTLVAHGSSTMIILSDAKWSTQYAR